MFLIEENREWFEPSTDRAPVIPSREIPAKSARSSNRSKPIGFCRRLRRAEARSMGTLSQVETDAMHARRVLNEARGE
jgi:hypothetical protein